MRNTDDFDDTSFLDRIKHFWTGLSQQSDQHAMPAPIKLGFVFITFLFVLSVLWTVFSSGSKTNDEKELARLPLLTAETDAFRTRPDDPGGMEIPNEDSTLFGALDGGDSEEGVAMADTKKAETKEAENEKPVTTSPAPQPIPGLAGHKQFAGIDETLKSKLGEPEQADAEPEEDAAVQTDAGDISTKTAKTIESQENLGEVKEASQTQEEETLAKEPDEIENLSELVQPKEELADIKAVAPLSDAKTETKETAQKAAPKPISKPDDAERVITSLKTDAIVADDSEVEETRKQANTDSREKQLNDIFTPILGEDTPAVEAETEVQTEAQQTTEAFEKPAAKPSMPPSQNMDKKYYVQLGSVGSQSKAQQEWDRLQSKFAPQLGGQAYRVQEADLGSRGTFYRVQAGPFDQQQARDICSQLKKVGKPGGCLVVAP